MARMDRRNFLLSVSSYLLFSFMNKIADRLKLNMPEGLGKHKLNELYHYKMSDLYHVKMNPNMNGVAQTTKKNSWYLPFMGK
jgi:hypothetical protein